jgi:hypothetical protein
LASAKAIVPLPVHRSTHSGAGTPWQGVDGVLDDRLGLRPRHEHARADLERDVAEADAAGEVLQRDAVGPPGDELVVRRRPARVEVVDHQQVGRPASPSTCTASARASCSGCRPPAAARRAVAC